MMRLKTQNREISIKKIICKIHLVDENNYFTEDINLNVYRILVNIFDKKRIWNLYFIF